MFVLFLTIFNSKISLNLKRVISKWLVDLRRYETFKALGACLAIMRESKRASTDSSRECPREYRQRLSRWLFISTTPL